MQYLKFYVDMVLCCFLAFGKGFQSWPGRCRLHAETCSRLPIHLQPGVRDVISSTSIGRGKDGSVMKIEMGGSINAGTPIAGWFIMENPI